MTPRPHDALFKAGFADPSRIPGLYLRSYPSELCNCIDWSSLRPEPASFIDPRLDDDHSDLLYKARLHSTGTEQSYVYLLLEHQSTNLSDMPLRLHVYLGRIYERQRDQSIRPLAHVLPLVVAHAPEGWTAPRRFCELFAPATAHIDGLNRLTPQFDVTILDVTQMTNEALEGLALPTFGKLVLWLLRDGRNSTRLLANIPEWAPRLREALQSPSDGTSFSQLLSYIFQVTESLTYERFCATVQEHLPEAEQLNMTIAKELELKGRLEGRLEGSLNVLEKQLTLKFGPLAAEHRERLSNATEEQIELYAQRVLTADTLEAVFVEPS